MNQLFKKYLVILGLLILLIGGSIYWYHLFDSSVPLLGKDGTLFALATGLITFFFWSSVVFGVLQWFFDQKEKQKNIFLENFTKTFDLVQPLIFDEMKIDESMKIKINSFKEIKIINNSLDLRIFWWESWIKEKKSIFWPPSIAVFDLINLIYLNKTFLEEEWVKKYIGMKLSLLGNLNLFYYYFVVLQISRNNSNYTITYLNEVADKLLINNEDDMKLVYSYFEPIRFIDAFLLDCRKNVFDK